MPKSDDVNTLIKLLPFPYTNILVHDSAPPKILLSSHVIHGLVPSRPFLELTPSPSLKSGLNFTFSELSDIPGLVGFPSSVLPEHPL